MEPFIVYASPLTNILQLQVPPQAAVTVPQQHFNLTWPVLGNLSSPMQPVSESPILELTEQMESM